MSLLHRAISGSTTTTTLNGSSIDSVGGSAATAGGGSTETITLAEAIFNSFQDTSPSHYDARQTKIDIFCDTHPKETATASSLNLTRILVCGLLKVIIDVVGLLGNCLTLIVLRKPNMKSSMTTILVGLTLFDSLLLFVDLSCFSLPTLLRPFAMFDVYTNIFAPFVAPYAYPLINVGLTGSEYFTMFVTIERYLVVCWPFKVKYICTHRNIVTVCIFLSIFSFALNIPRFFEHQAVKVVITHFDSTLVTTGYGDGSDDGGHSHGSGADDGGGGGGVVPDVSGEFSLLNGSLSSMTTYYQSAPSGVTYYYEVHVTKFGAHPLYKFTYLFMMWTILRFILPFGTLLVLNIAIWRRISRAHRFIRSRSTEPIETPRKEFPITQMSFCIVAVFAFCTVPYLFNRVLRGGLRVPPVPFMVYFSTICISFNSAINWFIYSIFSKKYRYNLFRVIYLNCPCFYTLVLRHFMPSTVAITGNSYYFGHPAAGSHTMSLRANRTVRPMLLVPRRRIPTITGNSPTAIGGGTGNSGTDGRIRARLQQGPSSCTTRVSSTTVPKGIMVTTVKSSSDTCPHSSLAKHQSTSRYCYKCMSL